MRECRVLSKDAIFIQGILARSGTNFLYELLALHPDVAPSGPVQENFFLLASDRLEAYVDATMARWKPEWGIAPDSRERLWESIGDGLIAFLERDARPDGARWRLLARTPHVHNLHNFARLWPKARLVILVRDGRDLVESFARSFNTEREPIMQRWADGAREIVEFERAFADRARFTIVRYEDLHANTEAELRKLLAFLALDPARYDFSRALAAPVIGSSTFTGGRGGVHWDPVAKTDEFKPLERSADWPPALLAEFERVAGEYARRFGYKTR